MHQQTQSIPLKNRESRNKTSPPLLMQIIMHYIYLFTLYVLFIYFCRVFFLPSLKQKLMKIHQYYVYIMTISRNKVLYTGVTNNLVRRCHEHKKGLIKGFTKKYSICKLVYYEVFDHIETAIQREKQIKTITRTKKESLINGLNPEWKELVFNNTIRNI